MKKKQSIKINRILAAFIVSIGFLLASVPVQAAEPVYVVVEYLKVKPEDHMRYLEVEQKIWKPMHQERINQGIIASWSLQPVGPFTNSCARLERDGPTSRTLCAYRR